MNHEREVVLLLLGGGGGLDRPLCPFSAPWAVTYVRPRSTSPSVDVTFPSVRGGNSIARNAPPKNTPKVTTKGTPKISVLHMAPKHEIHTCILFKIGFGRTFQRTFRRRAHFCH